MRRRPGISAGAGIVSWAARRMPVERPVATCDPPPAPLPPRRAHPVILATHSRWYLVVRLVKTRDGVEAEHIGEFPGMADAILLGTREVGHARVIQHGKLISTNGQPMEMRLDDEPRDDAYERAAAKARSNDFQDTGGKDWT